jgi:hypothetical protein
MPQRTSTRFAGCTASGRRGPLGLARYRRPQHRLAVVAGPDEPHRLARCLKESPGLATIRPHESHFAGPPRRAWAGLGRAAHGATDAWGACGRMEDHDIFLSHRLRLEVNLEQVARCLCRDHGLRADPKLGVGVCFRFPVAATAADQQHPRYPCDRQAPHSGQEVRSRDFCRARWRGRSGTSLTGFAAGVPPGMSAAAPSRHGSPTYGFPPALPRHRTTPERIPGSLRVWGGDEPRIASGVDRRGGPPREKLPQMGDDQRDKEV